MGRDEGDRAIEKTAPSEHGAMSQCKMNGSARKDWHEQYDERVR